MCEETHSIFFGGLRALRYNPCPDATRPQGAWDFRCNPWPMRSIALILLFS